MKSPKEQNQEELICSPAASRERANHLVLPGSDEAKKMTVRSGRNAVERLRSFGHVGSFLKTLLVSNQWNSKTCFLTWKLRAIRTAKGKRRSSRMLFQLVPSMPRTEETEFGLLPTMRARLTGDITEERKNDKNPNLEVVMARKMLRTPDANMEQGKRTRANLKKRLDNNQPLNLNDQLDAIQYGLLLTPKKQNANHPGEHGEGGMDLQTRIGLIPTARANDYKGASKQTAAKGRNPMTNSLMDAVENGVNPGTTLRLEPAFVIWMMGYPAGWCDLKDGE